MTTFLILCYGRSYISCYYVIDSTLLILDVNPYMFITLFDICCSFFAETPVFVDCKVTKCVRKKNSVCFALKAFKC